MKLRGLFFRIDCRKFWCSLSHYFQLYSHTDLPTHGRLPASREDDFWS